MYTWPSQSPLPFPSPQQPWVHFLSLWDSSCFVSKFVYTLLYLKCITNKTYCIEHGTLLNVMCQPGWERGLGENGYMYMYGWVPSLFIWNYHNIVNQLYSNTKCFFVLKKKKRAMWMCFKVDLPCPDSNKHIATEQPDCSLPKDPEIKSQLSWSWMPDSVKLQYDKLVWL